MAKVEDLIRPRISLRRFLFYFVTLAALVLIYLKFSEIRLLKEVFLRSNLAWLAAIIVTQVLSYYSLALNYRDVLRVKDLEVGVSKLFPITFVIQFLNQALPSATISGQAFFVHYLRKYGLTLAEGIGRAVVELLTLYVAFGVFFLVASIAIFRSGVWAVHPELAYFIYVFLFISVTLSAVFLTLQRRRRGRLVQWVVNRLHRYFEDAGRGNDHSRHVAMIFDQLRDNVNIGELAKRKSAFWAACFWQGMVLFFNVLTLYFISFAIGFPISFSVAFITFTLTKFVSMIAFVPGAFGVFEGGMTLILVSFAVSASVAFAMTLLFRAFTFWFPMPVGWLLYRWYLHRQELENPYQNSE